MIFLRFCKDIEYKSVKELDSIENILILKW